MGRRPYSRERDFDSRKRYRRDDRYHENSPRKVYRCRPDDTLSRRYRDDHDDRPKYSHRSVDCRRSPSHSPHRENKSGHDRHRRRHSKSEDRGIRSDEEQKDKLSSTAVKVTPPTTTTTTDKTYDDDEGTGQSEEGPQPPHTLPLLMEDQDGPLQNTEEEEKNETNTIEMLQLEISILNEMLKTEIPIPKEQLPVEYSLPSTTSPEADNEISLNSKRDADADLKKRYRRDDRYHENRSRKVYPCRPDDRMYQKYREDYDYRPKYSHRREEDYRCDPSHFHIPYRENKSRHDRHRRRRHSSSNDSESEDRGIRSDEEQKDKLSSTAVRIVPPTHVSTTSSTTTTDQASEDQGVDKSKEVHTFPLFVKDEDDPLEKTEENETNTIKMQKSEISIPNEQLPEENSLPSSPLSSTSSPFKDDKISPNSLSKGDDDGDLKKVEKLKANFSMLDKQLRNEHPPPPNESTQKLGKTIFVVRIANNRTDDEVERPSTQDLKSGISIPTDQLNTVPQKVDKTIVGSSHRKWDVHANVEKSKSLPSLFDKIDFSVIRRKRDDVEHRMIKRLKSEISIPQQQLCLENPPFPPPNKSTQIMDKTVVCSVGNKENNNEIEQAVINKSNSEISIRKEELLRENPRRTISVVQKVDKTPVCASRKSRWDVETKVEKSKSDCLIPNGQLRKSNSLSLFDKIGFSILVINPGDYDMIKRKRDDDEHSKIRKLKSVISIPKQLHKDSVVPPPYKTTQRMDKIVVSSKENDDEVEQMENSNSDILILKEVLSRDKTLGCDASSSRKSRWDIETDKMKFPVRYPVFYDHLLRRRESLRHVARSSRCPLVCLDGSSSGHVLNHRQNSTTFSEATKSIHKNDVDADKICGQVRIRSIPLPPNFDSAMEKFLTDFKSELPNSPTKNMFGLSRNLIYRPQCTPLTSNNDINNKQSELPLVTS